LKVSEVLHTIVMLQAVANVNSWRLIHMCIKQNIEYMRSHYNIEDFIYFNHHRREEHGHLHHYALNPVFKHFAKAFLTVWNLRFYMLPCLILLI